jgi:hypothetical protein
MATRTAKARGAKSSGFQESCVTGDDDKQDKFCQHPSSLSSPILGAPITDHKQLEHLFDGDGYLFLRTPKAIQASRKLTPTEKDVWSILFFHGLKNGRIFPSIETIAEEIGAPARTARRALKSLRKKGFVTWTTPPLSNRGHKQWASRERKPWANEYRLLMHESLASLPGPQSSHGNDAGEDLPAAKMAHGNEGNNYLPAAKMAHGRSLPAAKMAHAPAAKMAHQTKRRNENKKQTTTEAANKPTTTSQPDGSVVVVVSSSSFFPEKTKSLNTDQADLLRQYVAMQDQEGRIQTDRTRYFHGMVKQLRADPCKWASIYETVHAERIRVAGMYAWAAQDDAKPAPAPAPPPSRREQWDALSEAVKPLHYDFYRDVLTPDEVADIEAAIKSGGDYEEKHRAQVAYLKQRNDKRGRGSGNGGEAKFFSLSDGWDEAEEAARRRELAEQRAVIMAKYNGADQAGGAA